MTKLVAEAFAKIQDMLEEMGDRALADYHAGRTEPLIPEEL